MIDASQDDRTDATEPEETYSETPRRYREWRRQYEEKWGLDRELRPQRLMLAALIHSPEGRRLAVAVEAKQFDWRYNFDWYSPVGIREQVAEIAISFWREHGRPPGGEMADLTAHIEPMERRPDDPNKRRIPSELETVGEFLEGLAHVYKRELRSFDKATKREYDADIEARISEAGGMQRWLGELSPGDRDEIEPVLNNGAKTASPDIGLVDELMEHVALYHDNQRLRAEQAAEDAAVKHGPAKVKAEQRRTVVEALQGGQGRAEARAEGWAGLVALRALGKPTDRQGRRWMARLLDDMIAAGDLRIETRRDRSRKVHKFVVPAETTVNCAANVTKDELAPPT